MWVLQGANVLLKASFFSNLNLEVGSFETLSLSLISSIYVERKTANAAVL